MLELNNILRRVLLQLEISFSRSMEKTRSPYLLTREVRDSESPRVKYVLLNLIGQVVITNPLVPSSLRLRLRRKGNLTSR